MEGAGLVYAPSTDGNQDLQLTSTKDESAYAAISPDGFLQVAQQRPQTMFVPGNDVYMDASALNPVGNVVVVSLFSFSLCFIFV